MSIPPDELIWLISFIIACGVYAPFRLVALKSSAVAKLHLSLPIFFVLWLLSTSVLGLLFPLLGSDWMPAGFAAALLAMMPGISLIKWAGLFDWYNSHTTTQGIAFLMAAAVLNFFLYWAIDFVGSTFLEIFARRWRRHTKS